MKNLSKMIIVFFSLIFATSAQAASYPWYKYDPASNYGPLMEPRYSTNMSALCGYFSSLYLAAPKTPGYTFLGESCGMHANGFNVMWVVRYTFPPKPDATVPPPPSEGEYVVGNIGSTTCPSYAGANDSMFVSSPTPHCEVPPPPPEDLGEPKCPVGNPCAIETGNKFQKDQDWAAIVGPLRFARSYNALHARFSNAVPMGMGWTHNYNLRLAIGSIADISWNVTPGAPADPSSHVVLDRADGRRIKASHGAGSGTWVMEADIPLRLIQESSGWKVHDINNNSWESYNSSGQLTRIDYAKGQYVTLSYSSGRLAEVTDNFGRSLAFSYNSSGQISAVALPDAGQISYGYDSSGRLTSLTWPDAALKQYVYGESSHGAANNPYLLTGSIDEKGQRYANYRYDSNSRATHTEHAGGAQRYELGANGASKWVKTPYGSIFNYGISTVDNSLRVSSKTRNGYPCCDVQYTFDSAGNVTQLKNFDQYTTYTYNSRNLETSRTEGYGTALARTISTTWHDDFALPLTVSEPGRLTTYTYDSNGNVLTREIKDTVSNAQRTWTWTYNSHGQVLTEDGPRTDVSDVITYVYDAYGNLESVEDAEGGVTAYENYDAAGRVGQITYPDGRIVAFEYDSRGRVLRETETVGNPVLAAASSGADSIWPQWLVDLINFWYGLLGMPSPFTGNAIVDGGTFPSLAPVNGSAITEFIYDATGELTEVHLPDGEVITHVYDAAHRLIGINDQFGNSITYTLNAAGDTTKTEVRGNGSTLLRKVVKDYGSDGRLSNINGNSGQMQAFLYDIRGNMRSTYNAAGQYHNKTYDILDRLITESEPATPASQFSYNALDQLTSVKDPRNNTTTYVPNAFGEVEQEQSPDTGTLTRTYANGLLMSSTDSLSITTSYQYDAKGRITQRQTGSITNLFSYDAGSYGKGRLTRIEDASGTTDFTYNSQGNVVEKLVGFKDASPLRVRYAYTLGGKLRQAATPGRHLIEYSYGTNGLLTGVSVDGVNLLDNVTYGPEGIKGWTWAVGGYRAETTDLDARLTGLVSGSALQRSYGYNNVNRLTSLSDTASGVSDTYAYTAAGRLNSEQRSAGNITYAYDNNGNRTSKTQGTATAYTIASTSNRLTKIGSGPTITYLATGQTSYDGSNIYGYNDEGRLASVTQSGLVQTNTYNALGQRVKKAGAQTLYFMYDEAGHLLGEYQQNGAVVREYIWLGDRLVGLISAQKPGVVLQVHTDHLGSPRAVSEGATVLWRWEGDAFGNTAANEDVDADTNPLTMPLRFPGQYKDPESGLNYNYFRDYNPATGRYVESDPIGLLGGLNTYAYVDGNPLLIKDFFGLRGEVCDIDCGKEYKKCELKCTGAGPWGKSICLTKCVSKYCYKESNESQNRPESGSDEKKNFENDTKKYLDDLNQRYTKERKESNHP